MHLTHLTHVLVLRSPDDAQFVYTTVTERLLSISTQRHGCCVVQRCIDVGVTRVDETCWLFSLYSMLSVLSVYSLYSVFSLYSLYIAHIASCVHVDVLRLCHTTPTTISHAQINTNVCFLQFLRCVSDMCF